MDITQIKCFAHQDVLNDTIIYAKRLEEMESIDCYDIGLYGIIETKEGYVLYEIGLRYDGEPFVWRKFMHLKSFMGFYKREKMRFLDSQSEKFITNYMTTI